MGSFRILIIIVYIHAIFQLAIKMFWVLSLLKSWTEFRHGLEQGNSHVTIYYMKFLNHFMYSFTPLVFYINVHMKFKEIGAMLDAISTCSLIGKQHKFWVGLQL